MKTRWTAGLLALSLAVASCGAAGAPTPEPVALEAPSQVRYDHAMVWTGSELLVVGGHRGQDDSGAIVDDEPQRWTAADGFQPILAPPGPVASGQHSAWTGSEMIIWSGSTEPFGGSDGRVANAAAYDPTTMSWRELAPNAPQPVPHSSGKGVFVGGVAAFASGPFLYEGPSQLDFYYPDEDRWGDPIELPGNALDMVTHFGTLYVFAGDQDPGVWRIDVATMAMEHLGAPADASFDDGDLAVLDSALYVWFDGPTDEPSQLFRLDDAADGPQWTEIDVTASDPGSSEAEVDRHVLEVVDGWLVTVDGDGLRWMDPMGGAWARTPLNLEQECALGERFASVGEAVVGWNGHECGDEGGTFTTAFAFYPPELSSRGLGSQPKVSIFGPTV